MTSPQAGPAKVKEGGHKTDVVVPVERVLAVYEAWQRRERADDPEDLSFGSDEIASQSTGLSRKWFERLRSEPDRDVPFDSVDRMVTHLDLTSQWPFLMGAEKPDELTEAYCFKCARDVLANIDPKTRKLKCVWCRRQVFEMEDLERWYCPACDDEEALGEPWGKGLKKVRCGACRGAVFDTWKCYWRHCTRCQRDVWAEKCGGESRTWLRCVLCRKAVKQTAKKARPRRHQSRHPVGPTHLTQRVLLQARELYDGGMSMRAVAHKVGPLTAYKNPATAERGIAEAFLLNGWPLRGRVAHKGSFRVGENWRVGSEEQLNEARVLYEDGYSMRQVIDIMWPRLSYKTKTTAMSSFYNAFRARKWPLRTVSEVVRGRNYKHGIYAVWNERKDPSHPEHEEYLEFRRFMWRQWSRRGRKQCQHPGCTNFAGNRKRHAENRPERSADFCGRHEPGAKERQAAAMARRSANYGEVDVATIRDVLDAWKAVPGGIAELARQSGVPVSSLYRWSSPTRWPDGKLIKPAYAEQVRAIGAPTSR